MKHLTLGTIFLLLASVANAASFDCKQANTLIEKEICNNDELSQLDSTLWTSYQNALNTKERRFVQSKQRAWLLNVRNKCQNTVCIRDAYLKRIAALDQIKASNPFTGKYKRQNATLEITHNTDTHLEFTLNIFSQGNTREIKGNAHITGDKAVYTENNCGIIFKLYRHHISLIQYTPDASQSGCDAVGILGLEIDGSYQMINP